MHLERGPDSKQGTRRKPATARLISRIVESLEQRTLLAGTFQFSDGVLTFVGTSASEEINVSDAGPHVVIRIGKTRESFRNVRTLIIDAAGGNDRITLGKKVMDASLLGGSGDDTLIGGPGDDTLDGGAGDDDMSGGGGNDTADYSARTSSVTLIPGSESGEAGENDNLHGDIETLIGGEGNDRFAVFEFSGDLVPGSFLLEGRGGDDEFAAFITGTLTVRGGDGDDFLDLPEAAAVFAYGEGGDDHLDGAFLPESLGGAPAYLDGGDGDDLFHPVFSGTDLTTVRGGAGQDHLDFSQDLGGPVRVDLREDQYAEVEQISGSTDSDLIIAGDQPILIDGIFDGDESGDTLIGGPANDTIIGTPGADIIIGGGGDDVIAGESGPDTLEGGTGDDVFTNRTLDEFFGSVDADSVDGGDGFDFSQGDLLDEFFNLEIEYDPDPSQQAPVAESIATASPTLLALLLEVPTIISGVLTINGTFNSELIQVTQGLSAVTVAVGGVGLGEFPLSTFTSLAISGGAGNDTIILQRGDGTRAVTKSTVINGNAGDDTITGGAGNDVFVCNNARDGNDVFRAGAGTDKLDYSRRTVGVRVSLNGIADDGDFAGGERDNAPTDIEMIFGGSGNDTLSGLGRDDLISAGAGNDIVDGSSGNDYLVGSNGRDSVVGGSGSDQLLLVDGEVDHFRLGPAGEIDVFRIDFIRDSNGILVPLDINDG